MSGEQELGRGGRLRGGAASELVAAAYAAESAHGPRLAHGLSLADLAHAVALVEGDNVRGDDARALLRGLLELHEIPGDEFPWDPSAGDAFNSREAELERRIGRSAAGWLSAGRPRREAFRVGLRLTARASLRELHDALVDQAAALGRHARDTRTALATDYTYLQPAQPTTVGHLLLTYAYPALRDADRVRESYAALGLSVAGAGGSAGSRWALDRARLAELLGCDGLIEHAKDAAWQADVYVDLLATLAIAATHQSELGQDLEIYASQEFGLVELADQHSRASALMPQKKNPYALAAVRTQAGQAAGDVAAALVA
ncbi:MAG: lyase family protein, partial [Gaiellales bacterium]